MKINLVSPIQSHMGYAEMARLIWPGFFNHDVGCIDIKMQPTDKNLGTVATEMLSKLPHSMPDTTVANMVPILWNKMWGSAPGKKIGYTTWEAHRLPTDWVKICNSVDAIWTTSDWNKTVMTDSGVTVPVFAIKPTVSVGKLKSPRVAHDRFTFLSSFQWSERKNPSGLIRAFVAAFDQNKNVRLVIKTHGSAVVRQEIQKIIKNTQAVSPPVIEVIDSIVDRADISKLYGMADAFVSLSHGEGWGLPAWEAAQYGLPVLHTGWSAPVEFIQTLGQINYNLVPIYGMEKSVSPFFESSHMWAEPHLDIAVDMMRSVVDRYSDWAANAHMWQHSLCGKYSKANLVSQINQALE